jgi:hypothetical protein
MRIGNSELEYFIDYLNKRIHLLDLNKFGTMTLTNNLDPSFQQELINQESLLSDIMDFDWICYGTDGIITEYSHYNFKFLSYNTLLLHQPYVDKMKIRREKK